MSEQKAEAVRQLAKLAELFELTAAAFEGVRGPLDQYSAGCLSTYKSCAQDVRRHIDVLKAGHDPD